MIIVKVIENEINWSAISAIASILASITAIITVVVALWPYIKKGKLYFTLYDNIRQGPVLTIINTSNGTLVIEKINFYTKILGHKKFFFIDNYLKYQDDMVSDKNDFFLFPNNVKQIEFNATRIFEYMSNVAGLKRHHKKLKVWITVETNVGKITINTKMSANAFIGRLLSQSNAWKHRDVDSWFS